MTNPDTTSTPIDYLTDRQIEARAVTSALRSRTRSNRVKPSIELEVNPGGRKRKLLSEMSDDEVDRAARDSAKVSKSRRRPTPKTGAKVRQGVRRAAQVTAIAAVGTSPVLAVESGKMAAKAITAGASQVEGAGAAFGRATSGLETPVVHEAPATEEVGRAIERTVAGEEALADAISSGEFDLAAHPTGEARFQEPEITQTGLPVSDSETERATATMNNGIEAQPTGK